MGENGAGKSTLIKVLTGVYSIDEGTVTMDNRDLSISGPLEAQKAGISTVYQEVNLCPNLTVAENIFIGREPIRFGKINWKQMNKDAENLLRDRLHLSIDVKAPLQTYSVAMQQLIAIARALSISAKVLILDEPTSSLDKNEVQQLFRIMQKLKSEGLAILFVTHFLDQVYEMSDRLTVLRNGELEGEYIAAELPRMELVLKMIGKELEVLEELPKEADAAQAESGELLITAKALGRKGAIEPFDLDIRKGEVVGLAGLLGSGRTEIARLFFGADRSDVGKLLVVDTGSTVKSPRHAIDQNIAFAPRTVKPKA
ncbi:ATP-binding cassette domain-containing protein [Paenibacillus amylolyticus]|nr:ATP-binding cassette domain-containing protein [Paenibacillus amylolyticus]